MTLVILVAFSVVILTAFGIYQFWIDSGEQANLYAAAKVGTEELALRRQSKIDRALLRSRFGPRIEEALTLFNLSWPPRYLVALAAAVCLGLGLFLGNALSWLLLPVGFGVGFLLLRFLVRRRRNKRKEDFIGQMPDLARTLSNASSAGLSIRTAIAVAADELPDPVHTELLRVSEELNLGVSLDEAMRSMEGRLPSRELAILVSALVVSARSGGAIVTALRDIAGTLDTRKEVRREIKSIYSQTVATAYAVLGLGVMALFLLESLNSGTVDAMLRSFVGQAVLIFAGVVYAGCIWGVRRMTRIEI